MAIPIRVGSTARKRANTNPGTVKVKAVTASPAKPIGVVGHLGRGLFGGGTIAVAAPNKGTITAQPPKPIFTTKFGGGIKTAPISSVNF